MIAFLALKGQKINQSLVQRESSLRQADIHKNEFLSMLAHELRNPLSPISSAGQILKAAPASQDKVKEISEIIIRQADHISGLIDDLLYISRVSRGLIELNKRKIDLKQVTKEAVKQV